MIPGLLYLVATGLFVLGIQRMAAVHSARRGNWISAAGMLLAVVGVLVEMEAVSWWVVVAGLLCGGAIGVWAARAVPMTAMPELVAMLNGAGGAASALVALAAMARAGGHRAPVGLLDLLAASASPLAIAVGSLTLTGSLVAAMKLRGRALEHPLRGRPRNAANLAVALAVVALCALDLRAESAFEHGVVAALLTVAAGACGVLVVLPVGGADMPIVVSLLNSYSGIAGVLSGCVLGNAVLIVTGALVGSSGAVLSRVMCKAMNRHLGDVLLGGLGAGGPTGKDEYRGLKRASVEDVAALLDSAGSCIVVPGFGLAAAQAQHALRDLQTALERRGCKVRYAIHPVAGRMPGHMNVLLAEADIPYDQLYDLDRIRGEFRDTDVALVIGANDVINPAARDPASKIAGMPILDVDEARTVVVIKRSLAAGYAGIKNPLFERPNCLMLFEDAKQGLQALVKELEAAPV